MVEPSLVHVECRGEIDMTRGRRKMWKFFRDASVGLLRTAIVDVQNGNIVKQHDGTNL